MNQDICQHCGENVNEISQEIPFCDVCKQWGITHQEIYPTVADMAEQFHRLGKGGTKYWGRLGGGIVFTDGEKILLLKRDSSSDYPGHWCIPGGKAKEGEAPIDVAHREAKEECGSVEGQRFGHFHSNDGAHHFHTYLMAVTKPFEVRLSKEHDASEWVDLDDVLGMKLHPKFKESWPTYLRAIKKKFPNKTSFAEWCEARKKQIL